MKLQTKLFFALVVVSIFTGLLGYNTSQVSNITIYDTLSESSTTITSKDIIKELDDALIYRDQPVLNIIGNTPLFSIIVKHPLFGQSKYYIYEISKSRVVIGNGKNVYSPRDNTFFYQSPFFESIYSDRLPSDVNIINGSDTVRLPISGGEWELLKYDGIWYSASISDIEIFREFSIDSKDKPLEINFQQEPTEFSMTFTDDQTHQITDVSLIKSEDYYLITAPENECSGVYTVNAIWEDSSNQYNGTLNFSFRAVYDYRPTLSFEKTEFSQGEPISFYIKYADDHDAINISTTLDEPVISLPTPPGETIYLMPSTYNTPSGDYEVILNNQSTLISVIPRDFNVQHLEISEDIKTTTRNAEANAEFDAKFTPLRELSSEVFLGAGDFILPVIGRLSTEYGETRDVNGSPTTYRHSGWDIASPKGTPVHPSNRGKVVFAEPLTLTGNTIIIDHGCGIFSAYFHLDTLSVDTGDMVEKSDYIGTVGTTGFSTGPHLHFILSIYNENIEPGYLIYSKAMTYENYHSLMSSSNSQ